MVTDRSDSVKWFQECDLGMIALVGGKNASLGEMLKADIPVPPGFAVTTAAYDKFLEEAKIKDEIFKILKEVDSEHTETGEKASQKVREIIEGTPVPIELEDHIGEYYRILSQQCRVPAVPAAVRSSATSEDLPDASFAGQQETFLWIRGVDNIIHHVRKCWSSLFTPRAIAYRTKWGFNHEDVSISVGVQKMVKSFTAGVMFTINPGTGDKSVVVIDANYGFGESVVSGEVTPDYFLVSKVTQEILKRKISNKECMYVLNPETYSVEKQEIQEERRNTQCIIDQDIASLAKIGKMVEQHYGKPMDIEWAIDKDLPSTGNVLILQSRPETVWSKKKKEPITEKKGAAIDHIVGGLMTGKKIK